jgi:hypothetical protein
MIVSFKFLGLDRQRAVFRYAQKTPFKEIYRGERVFEVKNLCFFTSKTRSPLKKIFARISSVAGNSA